MHLECICGVTVGSFMLQDSMLSLPLYKETAWLTAGGCVSNIKPWEARSAGIAANSVVAFCIHTDISAPLTFIDIYTRENAI